jgi:polyisoprenoid-binding protein YceI
MNASRAELANRFSPDASVAPRRIVHHVQGRQHGPIKRLVAAVLSLVLASAAAAEGADIKAPKGTYKNDPYHSSLTFKIDHMGLSHYTARFIKFDATLDLDPAKLGSSSVTVNIDPTSVRTDYSGDFKAGHKDSPYKTFDEEITRGDKFLNADKFSTITFKSTNVVLAGKTLKVTGDLTFLGVTKPVTLLGSVVGSVEKHPLLGKGVVGFSTTGTVKRSDWGMIGTQAFLGDDVTIIFEGEFDQQ